MWRWRLSCQKLHCRLYLTAHFLMCPFASCRCEKGVHAHSCVLLKKVYKLSHPLRVGGFSQCLLHREDQEIKTGDNTVWPCGHCCVLPEHVDVGTVMTAMLMVLKQWLFVTCDHVRHDGPEGCDVQTMQTLTSRSRLRFSDEPVVCRGGKITVQSGSLVKYWLEQKHVIK